MQATEREIWLLNFYRNSELHGALLMGRLARSFDDPGLLVNLTRHCATEARHAALLTEAIAALGARLDPRTDTIQARYAAAGGRMPTGLADLLVLSETLEKRVLASYRAHLRRADVHPATREVLTAILREMEEEDDGMHEGWIEEALGRLPHDQVEAAEEAWRAVDARVTSELEHQVNALFPKEATVA